tara:strand:- start:832 stop:1083 length:252 start_codon:yes stop_codon:yes gene_type:complete
MKIDKLLDLQAVIEGRKRSRNMNDDSMPFYYSQSKDQHINILFLELDHFVNAFKLTLEENADLRRRVAEFESEPTMVLRRISR